MIDVNFTLIKKRISPWFQLAMALALGWTGMLVCRLIETTNGREYFAAMVGIIFYTLLNTVISIGQKSFMRYTVPSYYIYIILLIVLLLSAKFISGISIWKLEEYRMMIFSITLFYFIVSILVRGMRFIFEMAEND